VHIEERLPVATHSPALARRTAERALSGVLPRDRMDALVLAVSELVTNAVRHAGMHAGEEISVSMDQDGDRIHIEVQDSGRGFDPARWSDAGPQLREGGQGLRLVQEMADRWGVEPGPPTRVWFEFRSRPAAAADPQTG
jgi:anti-sigma regulatory factor (Ser/Thr protein kinase)